jgi:TRAP-type C4-dicarboxylate transport system substrate-binding protein
MIFNRLVPMLSVLVLASVSIAMLTACGGDDTGPAAPVAQEKEVVVAEKEAPKEEKAAPKAAAAPAKKDEAKAAPGAGVKPVELSILSAWVRDLPTVDLTLKHLEPALKKHSNGLLTVSFDAGPETVPPFEQITPVSAGLFDVNINAGGYHSKYKALGDAQNMSKGTYQQRLDCGLTQQVDENYRRVAGLKNWPVMTGLGGAIISTKPVTSADLTGLNLRASGYYAPFVKSLGGGTVRLSQSDIYTALDRGVIHGAALGGGIQAGVQRGYIELTDYVIKPYIGMTTLTLLMNEKTYNGLDPFLQEAWEKAIAEGSPKWQIDSIANDDNLVKQVKKEFGTSFLELRGYEAIKWKEAWFNSIAQIRLFGDDSERAPGLIEAAVCVRDAYINLPASEQFQGAE